MIKDKKWKEERKEENKNDEEWIGNKIGCEGAKTISETLKINTSLTSLILWSDEKIRNVMREKNELEWKWWIIIGNEIGSEGAKTISETLKINTSLTELDLGCEEKIRKEKRENKMKRNEGMNR